MPVGMISKLVRCCADARFSRGYQSSGVAILRPFARVTISSVAVNSTPLRAEIASLNLHDFYPKKLPPFT
jgi:hypothetical protein